MAVASASGSGWQVFRRGIVTSLGIAIRGSLWVAARIVREPDPSGADAEPLEGYWWNRSKEWSARNRRLDVGRYDFATRYLVGLTPLPAFRHLTPKAYQDKVAELIREIEEEGEKRRQGDEVASLEKILSQDPYEVPTRKTKRSSKPRFHVASKQARIDLEAELAGFLAQYWEASEALRRGNLKAAASFPEDFYPPALAFYRDAAPASAAGTADTVDGVSGVGRGQTRRGSCRRDLGDGLGCGTVGSRAGSASLRCRASFASAWVRLCEALGRSLKKAQ